MLKKADEYVEIGHKYLDPDKKHLFIYAHQDDEVGLIGTIYKLSKNVHITWVTNGDGLYFTSDMTPDEYGKMRIQESFDVADYLGIKKENRNCLAFSEVENYRHFVVSAQGEEGSQKALDFYYPQLEAVYNQIISVNPDQVWTGQFQMGHPEHDLIHVLVALALRKARKVLGKPIPLIEQPEYELTIAIPLRFSSKRHKGTAYCHKLDDETLMHKLGDGKLYPSQEMVINRFKKVMNLLGFFKKFIGKGFNYQEYVRYEYFSPVPEDRDYTKSNFKRRFFEYMFDNFEKDPIYFQGMLDDIFRKLIQKWGN